METTKFAIIVAGGTGSRMRSPLPKQYLLLDNTPVLMYSIRAFDAHDPKTRIIVVVSDDMLDYWQELCAQYDFRIAHDLVKGGKFRIESVHNALTHIATKYPSSWANSLIAVHDSARPLIGIPDIHRLYAAAAEHKAVIPALPSTNSIRIGTENKSETIDRNLVWQVQTPQVFEGNLLLSAYQTAIEKGGLEKYTDDAAVVEEKGNTVHLLPGDYRNIKITHPEDISIALIYLKIKPEG